MADPIRPSLAQMLNPTPVSSRAPSQAPTPATARPNGFSDALAAQRAFFQQVSSQKVTPATYTAADVARASSLPMKTLSPSVPKEATSSLSQSVSPAKSSLADTSSLRGLSPTPSSATQAKATFEQDDIQPLRRPGSFLNIVV